MDYSKNVDVCYGLHLRKRHIFKTKDEVQEIHFKAPTQGKPSTYDGNTEFVTWREHWIYLKSNNLEIILSSIVEIRFSFDLLRYASDSIIEKWKPMNDDYEWNCIALNGCLSLLFALLRMRVLSKCFGLVGGGSRVRISSWVKIFFSSIDTK